MNTRFAGKTPLAKTTAGRRTVWLPLLLVPVLFGACSAGGTESHNAEEEEALSRTEFTDRIENFFEYTPLKAGKPSQFLIHLTDLADGTPVEQAEVTLVSRSKAGAEVLETKARVGKVTGIYVAEVALPRAGTYDIEFRVTNGKIDERLALTDFTVE